MSGGPAVDGPGRDDALDLPEAVYGVNAILTLAGKVMADERSILASVVAFPDVVVKLYRQPDPAGEGRLRELMRYAPADPTADVVGHSSFAWPSDVVRDGARQFVGFAMPRVASHGKSVASLLDAEHGSGETWDSRVHVAANVAGVLAALHEKGCALGRLRPEAFLVTSSSLVTLVACDEVVPPSSASPDLRHDDLVQLAALLERLLVTCGRAGSAGRPSDFLPPRVRALLAAADKGRAGNGATPPSAVAWRDALMVVAANLRTCGAIDRHRFPPHLRSCPWCAVANGQDVAICSREEEASGKARSGKTGQRPDLLRPSWVALAVAAAVGLSPGAARPDPRVGREGVEVGSTRSTVAPPITSTRPAPVTSRPTTTTVPPGQVLMRDDFSTTDKQWLVKADESFTTEIVDQQFRASTAARSGVQFNIPGTSSVRGGVRIDVDVAMTGPETRAGLTCRNKVADYYYRAEVDSRGYWQVTPYVGQIGVTSNPYVQAQSSDRTVPALRGTGWNRISFECAGSDETGDRVTLRLWVNGSLIAETEVESGFGPGGLSLYAGSGAESGEVRFDNLVVSRV